MSSNGGEENRTLNSALLRPCVTVSTTPPFVVRNESVFIKKMAEAKGFEPLKAFKPQRFSRACPRPTGLLPYVLFI